VLKRRTRRRAATEIRRPEPTGPRSTRLIRAANASRELVLLHPAAAVVAVEVGSLRDRPRPCLRRRRGHQHPGSPMHPARRGRPAGRPPPPPPRPSPRPPNVAVIASFPTWACSSSTAQPPSSLKPVAGRNPASRWCRRDRKPPPPGHGGIRPHTQTDKPAPRWAATAGRHSDPSPGRCSRPAQPGFGIGPGREERSFARSKPLPNHLAGLPRAKSPAWARCEGKPARCQRSTGP